MLLCMVLVRAILMHTTSGMTDRTGRLSQLQPDWQQLAAGAGLARAWCSLWLPLCQSLCLWDCAFGPSRGPQ